MHDEDASPEAGGDDGTAQSKTKRDFEVTLRFISTLGGQIGPDTSNLDEIIFRTGSDPMDSSPPLFTGDKKSAFGAAGIPMDRCFTSMMSHCLST